MNVYDEAHVLAGALKESQEYKTYMEMKDKVNANPELTGMLNDFQAKQFQMQAQQMMGGEAQPDMAQQIQSLYQILMADPLAAQYLQAEFAFTRMVSEVYSIIGEVVQPGGFSGETKAN